MTNIIVYSLGEEHDNDVKESFIRGYSSNGSRFSGKLDIISFDNFEQSLSYASENDYQYIIYSHSGAESLTGTVNNYYPNVICFIPAGSNSHQQVFFQSITNNNVSTIITGCSDNKDNNVTGYNVEFIDIDPISNNHLSSYSTGYIAGKIAYIKDWYKCSDWEARYIARQTASKSNDFTDEHGFGIININDALNTYIEIPEDEILNLSLVGSISVSRLESKISINIDEVLNANNYKIYRNDEVVYSGSNTTYTDTIIPNAEFIYKYSASNNKEETDFSNTQKIVYRAYTSILY